MVRRCTGVAPAAGTPATLEALASRGPYGFATRDFVFVDATRPTPPNGPYPGSPVRTLPTRVFYPAWPASTMASPPPAERVPVAGGGPFPLLAYAHGFTARGEAVRFMAEHLASHGYIIAAPLFPLSRGDAPGGPTIVDVPSQPGDLAFVMRRVATLDGDDSDLAAAANTKLQGIMGLSLGGLTVLLATYHPTLHIQGIDAAVAQAPKSCFLGQSVFVRPLPTLILTGTADEPVPPEGPERVFSMAPPPVMLVELLGGTHTGFMNREQPLVANTDTRECELLVAAESSQAGADFGEALRHGAWPDAYSPNACPPTCSQRLVQTMGATRQLQLARAATLAHFEATLRGRQDAAAFLTARLDQLPDVQVQSKP